MKKINVIMAALGLVLALSQCNKNSELNPIGTNAENVFITLDVRGKGTKADVNPATGIVAYAEGDAIQVASGGKYVGTLTYNGGVFSGPISNAVEGSPLQFYFLGNVIPAETLVSGETESCSVVISDQTGSLPVISMASSNENYMSDETSYSATLLNKCALVKFNVTTSSSAATCVVGMNNKVTVNFSENTLTSSKEGKGILKLAAGNGEKWAVLLPQAALDEGELKSVFAEDCSYIGVRGSVPTITENSYLTTGITITVSTEVNQNSDFEGAINGIFTINDNGDYVFFSQGNLQYNAAQSTHATADGGSAQGTWRFAENQYDCIGDGNDNTSQTYDGWIDLFGWATSGWNNGNTYYQPWDYVNDQYGYGPTDGNELTGEYANADWGVYNAISNGGNEPNLWRLLTKTEWEYVICGRDTPSGIRYAMATVNGVGGVVLLPDYWNSLLYTFTSPNKGVVFETNVITLEEWESIESGGAVFLPASGLRSGTVTSPPSTFVVNKEGSYWSSTTTSGWDAYTLTTGSGNGNGNTDVEQRYRFAGFSVRLVRDTE